MDIFIQDLQRYQLQTGGVHGFGVRAFKSRGKKICDFFLNCENWQF